MWIFIIIIFIFLILLLTTIVLSITNKKLAKQYLIYTILSGIVLSTLTFCDFFAKIYLDKIYSLVPDEYVVNYNLDQPELSDYLDNYGLRKNDNYNNDYIKQYLEEGQEINLIINKNLPAKGKYYFKTETISEFGKYNLNFSIGNTDSQILRFTKIDNKNYSLDVDFENIPKMFDHFFHLAYDDLRNVKTVKIEAYSNNSSIKLNNEFKKSYVLENVDEYILLKDRYDFTKYSTILKLTIGDTYIYLVKE